MVARFFANAEKGDGYEAIDNFLESVEAPLGLTVGSVDATPTPEALSGLVEGLAETTQHPEGAVPDCCGTPLNVSPLVHV